MRRLISKFLNDESGATAIEYCLLAAGLSIVIVAAVNGIGSNLNGKFTSINTSAKVGDPRRRHQGGGDGYRHALLCVPRSRPQFRIRAGHLRRLPPVSAAWIRFFDRGLAGAAAAVDVVRRFPLM